MLNRIRNFAVILMLIVPLAARAQGSQVSATTLHAVNMRSGPGQQYALVGTIPADTSVPIEARTADSQWLLVTHQAERAWIASWLVTVDGGIDDVPISSEIVGSPVRVVTQNATRIRSGPGTTFDDIGSVPMGVELSPEARNPVGSWLLITYQGTRGWIARWLTDVNGGINLLPVADESGMAPVPTVPASDTTLAVPEPGATPTVPAPTSTPGIPSSPGYTASMMYINGAARRIFERGQALGNRANAFTKVGASDTAKVEYLRRFDDGEYDLAAYAYLDEVLRYFSGSFNYVGQAMLEGMPIEAMLDPLWANPNYCHEGEIPLECDYRIWKPGIAFIKLVTASHDNGPYSKYYYDLETVIQFYIDRGVIPVVSTHPYRVSPYSPADPMNEAVRMLAEKYQIPLWDLWVTTEQLPDRGVDGTTHLTIPEGGRTTFFYPENMSYGMVRRNLETLEILHALLSQVILAGS
jgi:uncharacterized protein YraI